MAGSSVSACDISQLRELLDLSRQDRTTPAVDATFRALELIRRLVGCDAAQFNDHDSSDFSITYLQYLDDDEATVLSGEQLAQMDDDSGVELLEQRWWTSCCSLIERTGRPTVTTVRAGRSAREWDQEPLNRGYLQVADEAIMGFPIGAFRSLRILLPRETGAAFGDREITLLEMLLPHLEPLMTAAFEEGSLGRSTSLPSLTVRQQEILGLVRLGMPNKRVGRILGISEGTVRKHLENVFQRLGVQSRTAAVAVAFGSQPLPVEPGELG